MIEGGGEGGGAVAGGDRSRAHGWWGPLHYYYYTILLHQLTRLPPARPLQCSSKSTLTIYAPSLLLRRHTLISCFDLFLTIRLNSANKKI